MSVEYLHLPDTDDKTGLDDYLMAGHAVEDLWRLVEATPPTLVGHDAASQRGQRTKDTEERPQRLDDAHIAQFIAEASLSGRFCWCASLGWIRTTSVARAATPRETVKVVEVPVEKTVIKEVTKVVEVEKVIFPAVAFRFDSAELTDLGKGQVYLAAQRLKEKNDITVVIEGHTDAVGSESTIAGSVSGGPRR